ncbi:MAG: lamin tail domain-containing protein, partial [Phycisphaerales bacterium]|nr:lamin tail domain-containing protein [Phycisphaerales bacterium]
DRWQELRQSHFSITNLHRLIDSQANEVREAQPRERKRWGVVPRGGSYQGEVNLMKNWLSNRVSYFDGQLAQPPKLSAPAGKIEPGSIITISGPPTATVFYTLDGSDPRRAGTTNPAPNALVYSGPIQINGNARIVARSRDTTKRQVGGPPRTTPWSGPAIATYVVRTPPLLITEVMFHPADPPPGSTNSASDFEFVELKNSGGEPLALPGIHFASGIEFRFSATNDITILAPGERLVIVRNRTAFSSRYPAVKNIAGQFQGNLQNSGNRLTLLGPLEEPISDFEYQDDWAVLSDGFGFSLVLADEIIASDALADPSRWRLSARAGGSPGLPDPAPFTVSRVLINEVLAHSDPPFVDTVELYNPGTTPADISGWYLTDAYRNPRKYRFGPATFIPAQGHFLIDENSFGGAAANGFSLSSLGDDVYLFSADEAGELTGYVHGFDFGASANGVTFGRIEDSAGAEHFVSQTRMTFTQANSGPRIGPIVISEVMYEPPPIGTANNLVQDFVELLNLTDNPIPLYDPAYPTNAWKLRGGVDFDFPAGAILRNSSAAIVVSFNPRTDRAALAQFRARYALDESVTVFGPWRGALDNKGDSIRLMRPDAPQSAPSPDAGFVPYIVVDQVDY